MFCLPKASARTPVNIRLTALTPISIDNNTAPNTAVYPSAIENSRVNVIGTRFPAACNNAANACSTKARFLAIRSFTNVRLRSVLRLGNAAIAIGHPTIRFSKLMILSGHLAPTRSSGTRMAREYTNPPNPAALRITPIAAPRRRSNTNKREIEHRALHPIQKALHEKEMPCMCAPTSK